MLLSANTLINLEIYRNQTDYGSKGSLLWLMDHTRTKMGKRLLRDWIGRPLVNVDLLEERLDAVTEIKDNASLTLEKLKGLLKGSIPDLGRGMSRIQYGRVSGYGPYEGCRFLTPGHQHLGYSRRGCHNLGYVSASRGGISARHANGHA